MANLSENAVWTPVTRIEPTTVALGGDEVNSPNLQLKQLVDRTAFLKQQIEGITFIDRPFIAYKHEVVLLTGGTFKVIKIPKLPSFGVTLYSDFSLQFEDLNQQLNLGDVISAQLYVLPSTTEEGEFPGTVNSLPSQFQEGPGFSSKCLFFRNVVNNPYVNVNEYDMVWINNLDFTPSNFIYFNGFTPHLKVEEGFSLFLVIASPNGTTNLDDYAGRYWHKSVTLTQEI